jgi:hypothetical protein
LRGIRSLLGDKKLFIDGTEAAFEGRFFEAKHEHENSEGKDVDLGADLKARVQIQLLGSAIQGSGRFVDMLLNVLTVFLCNYLDSLRYWNGKYLFGTAAEIAQFVLSFWIDEQVL